MRNREKKRKTRKGGRQERNDEGRTEDNKTIQLPEHTGFTGLTLGFNPAWDSGHEPREIHTTTTTHHHPPLCLHSSGLLVITH